MTSRPEPGGNHSDSSSSSSERGYNRVVPPPTDLFDVFNMLDGVRAFLEGVTNEARKSQESFQVQSQAQEDHHLQQLLKARSDGYNDGKNMLLGVREINKELRHEIETLRR